MVDFAQYQELVPKEQEKAESAAKKAKPAAKKAKPAAKKAKPAAKKAKPAAEPSDHITPPYDFEPGISMEEQIAWEQGARKKNALEPENEDKEYVASNDAVRTAFQLLFGHSSRLDGPDCAKAIKKVAIKVKTKKGIRVIS